MKRSHSVLQRITLPILLVLLLQAVLLLALLFFGGPMQELRRNTVYISSNRARILAEGLDHDLSQSSVSTGEAEALAQELCSIIDESSSSYSDFTGDGALSNSLLLSSADNIISLLGGSYVSGGYVILGGSEGGYHPCLYLRDTDSSRIATDNSDLCAIYGARAVVESCGISLDDNWANAIMIFPSDPAQGFFNDAYLAAANSERPGTPVWCGTSMVDGEYALTCSVPLLSPDGQLIAVFGVEISASALSHSLSRDLPDSGSVSMLGIGSQTESGQTITPYFFSEGFNDRIFSRGVSVSLTPGEFGELVTGDDRSSVFISKLRLPIDADGADDETWVLGLCVSRSSLFSFYYQFRNDFIKMLMVLFVLGVAGMIVASKLVSQPIHHLVDSLHGSAAGSLKLAPIGITEIDELTATISSLSRSNAEYSQKFISLLDSANVHIGCFAVEQGSRRVFCSSLLFELFGAKNISDDDSTVDIGQFRRLVSSFDQYRVTDEDRPEDATYHLSIRGAERWVGIRLNQTESSVVGIAFDVTREICEKSQLRYDRDHDPLTGALNRRAFYTQVEELFGGPEQLKLSALLMADLDNLKQVNDNLGHEAGDLYIKAMADLVTSVMDEHYLFARLSGDEFALLLHGFDSEVELRGYIASLETRLSAASFLLSDGTTHPLSASVGYSLFPRDSQVFRKLLRFADIAMYKAKKSGKHHFEEYDADSYRVFDEDDD